MSSNDSFDASLSKSNTFFDETFEKDLFASFSGGDHHGDAMAITPSTGTPASANSIFGNDDLMSTSMSLSSSISSRFKKAMENKPGSGAQQQQQQQVDKLLHTSSSKIKKVVEMAPKIANAVSPKFGKRKGLNNAAAAKKKNKFKPTNLMLALGDTKPKAYNAGLDDNPFGDQDEAAMSQLGFEMYTNTSIANSTASGQFNVEGLKIGANGISDIPIMTQSQSQSQPAFSMSFTCDSPVKTFNMLNFNSPPQQSKNNAAASLPSTSAALTFDSPPPKRKQSDLKKKRYLPYSNPDDTLDDYVVVKRLGEGASSTVSLVKNKKTNLMYAQKVITTSSKAQPKLILSEVQSLLKCKKCPYIIQLHQAFYKNDKIHILLEYMDGNSLQELLKVAKRIPENILKLVAIQVLKGLSFLHTKSKIVHRDIKPANILIKKNGQVKISDFGLTGIYSRRKHGSEQNFGNGQHYGVANPLVFGTCQGTVLYMSPERIREEKHSFNSDIWSVGITLAELCTGSFPFKSVQYFDVLDEISNMKELPLDKTLCSEQFCQFVNACVQIDPTKRPTAPELLNHVWIRDEAHKDDATICSEVQQWLSSFPDL